MKTLIDAIGVRVGHNYPRTVYAYSLVVAPDGEHQFLKYMLTANIPESNIKQVLKETLAKLPVWDHPHDSLDHTLHLIAHTVMLSGKREAPNVLIDNHLFFQNGVADSSFGLFQMDDYYAIHVHPAFTTYGFTIPAELATLIRTHKADDIQCFTLGFDSSANLHLTNESTYEKL